MATTWDLYDSFNTPEALLGAKRSSYSSKGSLLVRDRDPRIQGKYHGQKPDCIPSLQYVLTGQLTFFSTEHKMCFTRGFSFYLRSVLDSEWKIKFCVCFFLDACLEFAVVWDRAWYQPALNSQGSSHSDRGLGLKAFTTASSLVFRIFSSACYCLLLIVWMLGLGASEFACIVRTFSLPFFVFCFCFIFMFFFCLLGS